MSTIHLFNDDENSSENLLGDLSKTIIINSLLETPFKERDENWVAEFLGNIGESTFQLAESELIIGPDGYPYFQLENAPKDQNFQAFVIKYKLKTFLLKKGMGLAINTHQEQPDWIFTYGDIVNYFLNNEFYSDESIFSKKTEETHIDKDEKILIGQPSETILPQDLRHNLREYLVNMGVKEPKIMLIARNYEDQSLVSQDLVFNITPTMFQSEQDFKQIMSSISWFLPRHYSYMGIDEQTIENGFMPL
ncbi:hypothetical protein ACFX5U_14130 [Sphingobacterium sp. SG20118]|uniref:hypothetical protein n=1 Tax=Sphingobacterium TaxID=28453 RepID=UPI0004F8D878|nr:MULTISPECIES: hypothetical protein [Sphingobacterium]AIM37907.1 hypothetical protein KO02_15340 [Sphingobacterium sp. ML3W]MDH5826044.1 hypothetical protein [Sphingobacterium faecium]